MFGGEGQDGTAFSKTLVILLCNPNVIRLWVSQVIFFATILPPCYGRDLTTGRLCTALYTATSRGNRGGT